MFRLNQTRNTNLGLCHTNLSHDMSGRGLISALSNLYSGPTATMLKNALPNSDETARPGFVGEMHGVLQLSNNKYGVANYLG